MTDKNADVEWLRVNSHDGIEWVVAEVALARRILAHIDQLEANVTVLYEIERNRKEDRRPTIHEIAAQIYAPMMRGMEFAPWAVRFAEFAYDAAEALVAEGGTRDGNE